MTHPTMQRVFDKTGKSPTEIAVAVGTSPQNVNNWTGRGISKKGAVAIAQAFGLSVDWILTGQGEMIPQGNAHFSDKEVAFWSKGDSVPDGVVAIDFLPNVYDKLGSGYVNNEHQGVEKLWFREATLYDCNVNSDYAKAIFVAGDSMLPELTDGQAIAIDTSATRIFDGEIYAFRVGDELKVKYLFKQGDGFRAVSRNDDKLRYPDEIYTTQDIESNNIEIIGQFWWKSETRRIRR